MAISSVIKRRIKRRIQALLVLALPVLLGVGPCSWAPGWTQLERVPGGILSGEVASGDVNDWSFVAQQRLCQLETRQEYPHSITVNCFNDGPELYVGCSRCEGKTWSTYISVDPRARIRIGDTVYSVTMNRIVDHAEMQVPWERRMKKMRGDDAEVPAIPPDYWLYRLTSR